MYHKCRINHIALILSIFCLAFTSCGNGDALEAQPASVKKQPVRTDNIVVAAGTPVLDTALYNRKLSQLVHNNPSATWPVKTAYPLAGAILPFNRIIAYYGNLYSTRMGVLGEYAPDLMIKKLQDEAKNWQEADSSTPVQTALHYIVSTAQPSPGSGRKYRLRMPFSEIDKVIDMAKKANALVFLDIQTGHSSVQEEIPSLEKYLSMPNVHLGIDPEYSMKGGQVPSSVIGTMDASDVNYASTYLADLVKKHKLPPKVLVVHRFTQGMLTNYRQIVTRPEVQIVVNMDGFGSAASKLNAYKHWITGQPVEFTGFKVFYKNDAQNKKNGWMQPKEILKVYPQPVYIQYQ